MMFTSFKAAAAVAAFAMPQIINAQAVHGSGAAGKTMGPVQFMWPSDRVWNEAYDNIAPCGSASGPANRTMYPLGSKGSVSLSIADDAWNVAFRIAYGNNPTKQSDFQQIVGNVSEIEAGHQCYSVPPITETASTNATIQLEYWSNDSGVNESFFACADIYFVQAVAFTLNVPCFNVTTDIDLPSSPSEIAAPNATGSSSTETSAAPVAPVVAASENNSGLSTGAKAGIAVGSIVGAFAIIGAIALIILRKRKASKKAAAFDASEPPMKENASMHSGRTAVA